MQNYKLLIINERITRSCKGLGVFLFLIFNTAFAQDIKVSATLDSNSILIGEQTKIHLTVNYKADQGSINIKWPSLNDTIIKQIEIVEKSKVDTTIPDKQNIYGLQQHQTLTITSFDSGFFAIPPFKFIINNDTSKVYETEAMLLQVNTLQIDTTQAIKDVKPPIDEPFDYRELIPYIKWGAIALAGIVVIVYILMKLLKRKPKVIPEAKPSEPPHIIALQALEKLQEEKLWQQGKIKQYHSSLTDIIRIYIQHRFKVNALEQTSDEIIYNFRSIVIDNESKAKLKQVLILSDLVKFAKEEPLPSENELSMVNAFDFINGTKREEEKINKEQSANAD